MVPKVGGAELLKGSFAIICGFIPFVDCKYQCFKYSPQISTTAE